MQILQVEYLWGFLTNCSRNIGRTISIRGAATNALQIGNTTNYGARTIKFTNAAAGVAGANGTIEGANATSGNTAGGDLNVTAGTGSGTAHGGSLTLSSGDHSGSGSGGNVTIKSYDSGGSVQTNALFTAGLASSFYGAVNLRSSETVTSSGATASSLTTTITKYNTTAGAQSPTLADGTEGQIKVFVMTVRGGSNNTTLTPSRKTGFSNLVFDAVGETATLMYVDGTSGWIIISTNGTTIS